MNDFLSMGGYGAYVWPAFIISAVTLGALTAFVVARARRAHRRLAELEKRNQ